MAIPPTMQNYLDQPYRLIDPFANLKPGQSQDFRSFTGTRTAVPGGGTMTIVSGHTSPIGDMQSLVAQGYTPEQASQAVGVGAESALNAIKAKMFPASTAADIAKTRADTNLIAQTAKYYGPTALADIAKVRAEAGLTGAQTGAVQQQTKENNFTVPGVPTGQAGVDFYNRLFAPDWWKDSLLNPRYSGGGSLSYGLPGLP